ncbi:hypothetical protein C8R42DRAFT_541055, partial [Lentinula raphanica]
GPGIPRRDRPEVYERYCRLMLILFKPWRAPSDLRLPGQAWSQEFDNFKTCCQPQITEYMCNMQLLHECKDSRDD